VALSIFGSGCEQGRVARASRDLALNITQSTQGAQNSANTVATANEQRIYLDASLSMRGFAHSKNHSTFDELIDELGDAMPGCKLYKYGQIGDRHPTKLTEVTMQVGFGNELHEPTFYGLKYNPDDFLIDKLAGEDHPALSVLVTDGVYSEPAGSTSPPVVAAIQKWLQQGRVLGIFMLSSAFDGVFYSERGRAMQPRLSVKSRPFYTFVFSPTNKALKDLQEKLQRRFPQMRAIRFSDEAVTCVPVINERLKGTYSYRKPPVTPYYWQMFDSEILALHNPASIGYGIKCSVAADYPVSEFNFSVATEYYRWQKGKFEKADAAPAGFRHDAPAIAKVLTPESKEPNDQTNPNSSAASIQSDFAVYFPKDSAGDYGFYYLKLAAATKELREDLKSFSTRDDRDPGEAGKTYRFMELVSAIADVHFKDNLATKTSAAIFVTLANH
jgi:hypothetical protein